MLFQMLEYFKAQMGSDEGATMAEYGLMVALVAIVVSVGAALLGVSINDLFTDTSTCLDTAPAAGC